RYVTLPTMYKTDRVPARFSVVSVQGSELPEVQPVASVLSLLGCVPVRSQVLDRPILDLNYPIRSQGRTGRFEYTSIPKLDATEIHYCFLLKYHIFQGSKSNKKNQSVFGGQTMDR